MQLNSKFTLVLLVSLTINTIAAPNPEPSQQNDQTQLEKNTAVIKPSQTGAIKTPRNSALRPLATRKSFVKPTARPRPIEVIPAPTPVDVQDTVMSGDDGDDQVGDQGGDDASEMKAQKSVVKGLERLRNAVAPTNKLDGAKRKEDDFNNPTIDKGSNLEMYHEYRNATRSERSGQVK